MRSYELRVVINGIRNGLYVNGMKEIIEKNEVVFLKVVVGVLFGLFNFVKIRDMDFDVSRNSSG